MRGELPRTANPLCIVRGDSKITLQEAYFMLFKISFLMFAGISIVIITVFGSIATVCMGVASGTVKALTWLHTCEPCK